MNLRVAVQMDPIETINIVGDSTFALMLEAQRRGHHLFYYHASTLALRNNILSATGHDISLKDKVGEHYRLSEKQRVDLSDYNVILMRQDPPFDMGYITVTHLLEHIHPKSLVVNDPAQVRNAPEKLFVLEYGQFMTDSLVTRNMDDLRIFRAQVGDMIMKPLYGNGGWGVFRLKAEDQNFSALVELFQQSFPGPFMAQRYLGEVRQGDKRIILVDGKIAGAINRVPAQDENRSNMHVGGKPEAVALTKRDHEICEAIGPELKKRGLIFVGIDVIGDYITEINVTSPTGIREIKHFGGADIAVLVWEAIEARL